MAQYHSPEDRYNLNIDRSYYSTLDIEGFSQMMKDPSYCYKFYWLEAIVRLISENVTETTFDAIIDEMIANAWYSVREFHIHLSGLQSNGNIGDGLERAVLLLSEISNLPANCFNRKNDMLQIRYTKNGELARALQVCFNSSYNYIMKED